MGVEELAVVGLVGSGVGTALGVPMAWPRARRTANLKLLGIALLLLSAIVALISARLAGLIPASAAVEHGINLIGLTAFPLAVLYTGRATGRHDVVRGVWLLVTPAVLYLAYIATCAALDRGTRVPFAWLLPAAVGFTAWSAALLWCRRTPPADAVVPPEWVVSFLVVVNLAQIVRMDFGHITLVRAVVPLVLSGGFFALVAYIAWRTAAPRAAPVAEEPPAYERSGLDDRAARALLDRIDRAVGHDRLYAHADLTLHQLAAAVGATPHQVSEALNRIAGASFRDLVNRRRVDEVKAQLLDPACDRFTVEGIGASAGFGSRSALHAAFRRLEGTTPAQFRARRAAKELEGNEA
jgi:AraC-like DNA-binding protein